MKDSSGQWVIKLQSDQVKGPYSTDAVRKMIINGAFSGNEEVSSYPDGDWQSLTKQPQFYDALLESLENPVEVDIKKAQKMEAETVVRVREPKQEVVKAENIPLPTIQNLDDLKAFMDGDLQVKENTNIATLDDQNLPVKRSLPPTQYSKKNELVKLTASESEFLQNRNRNLDIQMTDIQKLKKNEIKKLVPFLLILVLLGAGVMFYFYPTAHNERSGWILIAPKKNAEPITAEEAKNFKRRAVRAFQGGIMEQLLAAQPGLVQSVESSPKDLEGMALLCMLYEQLWPYSKQTPEDFKSITTVTQMVRSTNPISNYSDSCQSVFMLTKGQNKEARSLMGKVLDNPSPNEKFSLAAFLYLLQGEVLEGESNFINAAAFYDQASKLWPEWSTARFGVARMYYKQGLFSEAREQYQAMYNANKESKAALFGLGLVEIKGSKNIEKAITFFANGFKLNQALPKDFLTEALFNYAQVLLDKNDPKTALVVALQGYHINPSHRALKEMVISLGGDEKVENAQSEIMLIGDQFARAGDHMVAQAQYKAAFEVDSKNAMAAYKAAKSLWQINQTRDAIVWLEKSIVADPTLLQAYVLKSDYESQKYNFAGAGRTLQAASKRFPRSHEVLKAQALLEFRKNNMVGAIQYGERAVKLYNADVELLTMLAQAHIYYYMNAPGTRKEDIARKEQSKDAAKKYSGRAYDLEPAWPEAQITRAKTLAAFQGAVFGETYLKECIKDYPYTIEYLIALAEFYNSYEKYGDSVKIYESVVAIEPKNKKANFGLAETYRVLNKVDLAQKYYNATSMLDPTDVEPMFANAKLLIETAGGNQTRAKMEQAIAKLEIVQRVNPDFPKVSYLMAKCYLELGDYQKAIDMVRKEKTSNPNIADSFILAAEIFYRKKQYKDCATEYSSAIKMRPAKADLYIKASICYRNSDSIDIAQDMVDVAFEKESGNAENFREQGYISWQRGEKGRAVQCLKQYLDFSPNAPDKATVESDINQIGVSANGDCRPNKDFNK